MTHEQRREVAERLDRVVKRAYADQPIVGPDVIEEICQIIRFVIDPPVATNGDGQDGLPGDGGGD